MMCQGRMLQGVLKLCRHRVPYRRLFVQRGTADWTAVRVDRMPKTSCQTMNSTATLRRCSTAQPQLNCQRLDHRSLVRVAGSDASDFLQGLLTNDMRFLDDGGDGSAMYAMMLNVQGRILYDLILYRTTGKADQPCYLIECNSDVTDEFLKVMRRYKLRKKVDLSPVGEEYSVHAVFPQVYCDGSQDPIAATFTENCGANAISVPDPRLHSFCQRLILPRGVEGSSVVENAREVADQSVYHRRRYQAGIGEGVLDLPPGHALPLESNGVFLNAVSFTKGCYIGQELTARTHHTGVIRKRLMPVHLHSEKAEAEPGQTVENSSGKNCGKFRNRVGVDGLALLRLSDVLGKGALTVKDSDGKSVANLDAHMPHWWPADTDEVVKQLLPAPATDS